MKAIVLTASLFVLSLGAALPASAGVTEDWNTCRVLGHQVSAAMRDASVDTAGAQSEQRMGSQTCTNGLYKAGIDHYRKALDLLGAGQTAGGAITNQTLAAPQQ